MKRNLILAVMMAVSAGAFAARGGEPFSAPQAGYTNANPYALLRANPAAEPIVKYINVTGSATTNALVFYKMSNAATVTQSATPGSTVIYAATTGTNVIQGYAAGNVIVEWDPSTGTTWRNAVSAVNSNAFTLMAGLGTNASISSVFFLATTGSVVTVGLGNLSLAAQVWNGQPGTPLLVDMLGSSNSAAGATIQVINGDWYP